MLTDERNDVFIRGFLKIQSRVDGCSKIMERRDQCRGIGEEAYYRDRAKVFASSHLSSVTAPGGDLLGATKKPWLAR